MCFYINFMTEILIKTKRDKIFFSLIGLIIYAENLANFLTKMIVWNDLDDWNYQLTWQCYLLFEIISILWVKYYNSNNNVFILLNKTMDKSKATLNLWLHFQKNNSWIWWMYDRWIMMTWWTQHVQRV